ncbi:MAG: chemotaxis protein CheB [Pseudomonadota bacterium]
MSDDTSHNVIIGIAASAGGLEAVTLLVQNLPRHSGAIYVIAQHMSPTHKSLLSSLISRETALPVVELSGVDQPQADTIYVPPPNKDVTYRNGQLILSEPTGHPATPKPSADLLFKSLAANVGEQCVGIVLSGTGSDGSYGVQSIREAGGITLAQEPASAKYDGMPVSAIETGCVDLTLTPEQMGQHLEKILDQPRDWVSLKSINEAPSRLGSLMHILLAQTGVDFRDYKENTVNRRINRRMVALGLDSYDSYVEYCRSEPEEISALYRDLLISVTRFFRDPKQFEVLADEIAQLVENREDWPIRIWVVGCATGEECYTLAILVAEALGGLDKISKGSLQIFGTDIDSRALDVARAGVYPITAANDIPDQYLEPYFTFNGSNIEVTKELRQVILFSKHNVFQDPPFMNISLVSLRNVLIYFNTPLQERVLNRIFYALNNSGILFLGTSETVGALDKEFEVRSTMGKIFSKRKITQRKTFFEETDAARLINRGTGSKRQMANFTAAASEDFELFNALSRLVARKGFVATKGGEIVRIIGDITNVLSVTETSSLSFSVRMLRAPLDSEAMSLITVCDRTEEMREGLWHEIEAQGFNRARLVCYPIITPSGGEDHFLFSVTTEQREEASLQVLAKSDADKDRYLIEMEKEMQATQVALQQTVEELQTSNEELQSVNEELQSTSEEMQATNEELETSNEELQSTNEELITVNEELQINSSELQRITSELLAILSDAPYPMMVLDPALVVRRISSKAKSLFTMEDLPPTGIHLAQLSMPNGFPFLTPIANEALKLRQPRVVRARANNRSYSITLSPYADVIEDIVGLTVTIIEDDQSAWLRMAQLMDQLGNIGHWQVDVESMDATLSKDVLDAFGLSEQGQPYPVEDLIEFYHPDDRDMVREKVRSAIEDGETFQYQARLLGNERKPMRVEVMGACTYDAAGEPTAMVGAFRDVTQEITNSLLIAQYEAVQDELGIGFYSFDVDRNEPYWSPGLFTLLGIDPEEEGATVDGAVKRFHPDDQDRINGYVAQAVQNAEPYQYTARIMHKGDYVDCVGQGDVRTRPDGSVSHVYGSFRLVS